MPFPCHSAGTHALVTSWGGKKNLKGKCVEYLSIWKWPYFAMWLVVWLDRQLYIRNNLKALFHCILASNIIYILYIHIYFCLLYLVMTQGEVLEYLHLSHFCQIILGCTFFAFSVSVWPDLWNKDSWCFTYHKLYFLL